MHLSGLKLLISQFFGIYFNLWLLWMTIKWFMQRLVSTASNNGVTIGDASSGSFWLKRIEKLSERFKLSSETRTFLAAARKHLATPAACKKDVGNIFWLRLAPLVLTNIRWEPRRRTLEWLSRRFRLVLHCKSLEVQPNAERTSPWPSTAWDGFLLKVKKREVEKFHCKPSCIPEALILAKSCWLTSSACLKSL